MFVSLQNLCVVALKLSMMIARGVAFKRWLNHEGGGLTSGIDAHIKQNQQNSLGPFHHVRA